MSVLFLLMLVDYERVVNHYLQQQNYAEALDALTRQVWHYLSRSFLNYFIVIVD